MDIQHDPYGKSLMATARVFKSGNFQAVRLPKGFRLKGPYVEIFRRGDEIVLREKPQKKRGLAEAFDILASMPDDAFENIKDERPPEEREGL
jgi:antitoxin VapB